MNSDQKQTPIIERKQYGDTTLLILDKSFNYDLSKNGILRITKKN